MNTSRKGFVNSRYALLGLVALIVVGASVFATVSEAFAQEPTARNFFGTIVLIDNSVVRINTRDGVDLEVAVNDDTAVILPLNTDANITDLFEGDVVAVSLAEGDSPLVAEKIFVVSTQTKHKHIPADVIERTDSHITVDPINEKDRSLTFNITDKTRVVFRGGASSLDAGSFVVVIAVRDSNTGDLSPDAIEIHVSPVRTTSRPVETPENLVNRARIRGVFQEINEEDNWIIVAGTRVLVNTGTKIDSGLVLGQLVEVSGQLLDNGTILAYEIDGVEDAPDSVARLELEGAFDGFDDEKNWIVSGLVVIVRSGIDIDGRPVDGRRVRVNAIVLEDGSIIAREIRIIRDTPDDDGGLNEILLEGTFQGVEDGRWIVSHFEIGVDENTELQGSPEMGDRVKVRAVVQDNGALLALEIEVEDTSEDSDDTRREVEFDGLIQRVLTEGDAVVAISVRGHRIQIVELTEVRGNLGIGLFARVEAVILSNGSLVAREIETRMPGVSGAADDSKVDIRGVIQRMNEDGTLIQVNGIVIEIADNTRMEGVPRVGASVTGHGVLQSDGTVLARSLRVFGISDSVEKFRERIRGIIDEVILDDDGKVIGIVVDGRSIRIEVLTKIETSLKKGNYVEVEGILGNQGFIAQEVDQQDDQDETEDAEDDGQAEPAPAVRIMTGNTSASSRTVRHEGVVEALERRATIGSTMVGFIWVGGQRFAVTANTKIEDGVLAVGSYVEVEARANGDTMIALTIEIEEPDNDDTRGNNSNNSGSGSSGRNSG